GRGLGREAPGRARQQARERGNGQAEA
ncbi:MAG: hypothetical protein QG602_15, partial [Verrucomicrobiota bacterium]|nr:hypothetical protein [Verrucomicrobiota bacterium]